MLELSNIKAQKEFMRTDYTAINVKGTLQEKENSIRCDVGNMDLYKLVGTILKTREIFLIYISFKDNRLLKYYKNVTIYNFIYMVNVFIISLSLK